jgi:hypothetical protein
MALIKLNTRSIPDNAVTPAKVSVKHLGRRNLLINGAMQIWQRGTSFTGSNSYTADRWLTDTAGAHTRSTDTPAPFDYSIKLNPSSGNAVLRQAIELSAAGEGGIFQSGQQFTLSFWLKSSAGGEGINVFIASSTTVAGATTQMASAIGIATTTTGWVKYTYTFTQSVAVGSNDTCYNIVPYVVAPSGDIYITGLQFETGSVATDFEHRLIGEERSLCQRYYQETATASGVVSTSAIVYLAVQLMTEMRTVPSWSLSGAMMINDVGVNATQSSANITAYNSTTSGTFANLANFSGLTPYRGCLTRQAGGSYLIADAEL